MEQEGPAGGVHGINKGALAGRKEPVCLELNVGQGLTLREWSRGWEAGLDIR